jgi:hypothetical protein
LRGPLPLLLPIRWVLAMTDVGVLELSIPGRCVSSNREIASKTASRKRIPYGSKHLDSGLQNKCQFHQDISISDKIIQTTPHFTKM